VRTYIGGLRGEFRSGTPGSSSNYRAGAALGRGRRTAQLICKICVPHKLYATIHAIYCGTAYRCHHKSGGRRSNGRNVELLQSVASGKTSCCRYTPGVYFSFTTSCVGSPSKSHLQMLSCLLSIMRPSIRLDTPGASTKPCNARFCRCE
jgi:hypothetical protein